jgi:hypothetical protein
MKWTCGLCLAACIAALACGPAVHAANVDISMNVFPTDIGNPNGGGTWTLVAKTDSLFGIAAISFVMQDVNTTGITLENDIGAILIGGQPPVSMIGSAVNLVYGQDTASGPVVLGVGTPIKADPPDPFGNPLWSLATRIGSGSYSGVVPMFTAAGFNITDSNTLGSPVGPPYTAIDAVTTTIVRVAVPEPATVGLAFFAALGMVAMRRGR